MRDPARYAKPVASARLAAFRRERPTDGRAADERHLVGAHQQRGGYGQAESLCGLEIDDQLVFSRNLHWQIAGLRMRLT